MEIINKTSEKLVCDFCVDHRRPVKWWFTAKDDVMERNPPAEPGTSNVVLQSHPDGRSTILAETKGSLNLESVGGRWAACDRCRHHVDHHLVETLAEIAASQFIKNHHLYTTVEDINDKIFATLFKRIYNVQQAFWRNYDGSPAQPVEG